MKQYRIGEFAKQMGVSIDFIKYYESEGVIRSVQDPRNRYHYYDFNQSKLVQMIQYYRSFGFSAQDVVVLLRHADNSEVIRLFDEKEQVHRRRILDSTHITAQLGFMAHALRAEPDGTWYIIRHPAVCFLAHTNDEEYITDERTVRALKAWRQAVPYVYGVDRCVMNADKSLIQHGLAILEEDAKRLSLPLEAPVLYLPETRCLEYYLDVEHADSFDASPSLSVEVFEPVLRIVEEKHFTIAGDMFIRFISFYCRNGVQCEKNVLYIPVR